LWWTKWHWGRFSPSTSVSSANPHFTDCSIIIIIYHPTYQVDSVPPHPGKLKKETKLRLCNLPHPSNGPLPLRNLYLQTNITCQGSMTILMSPILPTDPTNSAIKISSRTTAKKDHDVTSLHAYRPHAC
jgi:hypothetical protein